MNIPKRTLNSFIVIWDTDINLIPIPVIERQVLAFYDNWLLLPPPPKMERDCFHPCLFVCFSVCWLLAKSKIFQVYWSVDFVILSVCLFVYVSFCLSPTGHNSKPIIIKLYQVVEVVSSEKPIDFEVKGHLEVKFLKSSIFIWKIVNFHPIDLKITQQLHRASLNLESNHFWE